MKPYRQVVRLVALYNGKLLAQACLRNLVLPGGGVDVGESLAHAIRRETLEETGAVIDKLVPFQTVRVDWTREWANTAKRRDRMRHFRGEEEHIFLGTVSQVGTPTSSEGDAWTGRKLMSIASALKHCEDTFPSQTPAFKVLVMAKMCAIRALQLVQLRI